MQSLWILLGAATLGCSDPICVVLVAAHVEDTDGRAVADARVQVEGESCCEGACARLTNKDGDVEFDEVGTMAARVHCGLRVEKAGYETATISREEGCTPGGREVRTFLIVLSEAL